MCNRFENKEGIAIYKKMDDKVWNDILKKSAEGILNNYSSENIKPTHFQPVLDNKDGYNITERRWGYWFPNGTHPYFNIQTETVNKRKDLKQKFLESRSIVGATSFYEWITRTNDKDKDIKICMKISIPSLPQFYFPAILGESSGEKNFTILTINPNKYMIEVHNRMPVILSPERAKAFLNDKEENLLSYCVPLFESIPMNVQIAPDSMLNKEAIKYVAKERERVQDEIDNPQLF